MGSTVFGLRFRQHRQYLTLVFFFFVKQDFEKGLIEAKQIAIKAEYKLYKNDYLDKIRSVVQQITMSQTHLTVLICMMGEI